LAAAGIPCNRLSFQWETVQGDYLWCVCIVNQGRTLNWQHTFFVGYIHVGGDGSCAFGLFAREVFVTLQSQFECHSNSNREMGKCGVSSLVFLQFQWADLTVRRGFFLFQKPKKPKMTGVIGPTGRGGDLRVPRRTVHFGRRGGPV
jgi:hypothetical protein